LTIGLEYYFVKEFSNEPVIEVSGFKTRNVSALDRTNVNIMIYSPKVV
jgi:hypothetical protein